MFQETSSRVVSVPNDKSFSVCANKNGLVKKVRASKEIPRFNFFSNAVKNEVN